MKISHAKFAMVILLLAAASSAQATPVTVPNFSFENPVGTGPNATNWTANGGAGTGGYANFGFTNYPDGSQYHWLNLPGFGGPDPSVTESNSTLIGSALVGTYTLTVAGGNRPNFATTDGKYVIELLAGGVVIGSQTLVDPSAISNIPLDTWKDITAVAVVNTGDAAVGQDLTIRLSAFKGMVASRSQGQFDNVRLDYNTAVPVELSGFTVE